jgi:5,10-methylenetetrahydrofolate reductase
MKKQSRLHKELSSGKFVITAEICPPRGTDVEGFIEKARLLKGKIVAANVTDNQRAVMRLSSLACAVLLLKEGVEPVFQMTCRDRTVSPFSRTLWVHGSWG